LALAIPEASRLDIDNLSKAYASVFHDKGQAVSALEAFISLELSGLSYLILFVFFYSFGFFACTFSGTPRDERDNFPF
jgi:hypothetical protein